MGCKVFDEKGFVLGERFTSEDMPSHIYDVHGKPMSTRLWGPAMRNRTLENGGMVGQEHVGEYYVSTVWLGFDHGFGEGPPLIFETMVFGPGQEDEYQERYATAEEAKVGHQKAVEWAKARK